MAELLTWDDPGKKLYETGVDKVVVYPVDGTGAYKPGYAWNGITGITESPEGAEITSLYANNQKYINLVSAEELKATIEAYTYPDAFATCDGTAELATGVRVGQQNRTTFGLCYRTTLGNDSQGNSYGYKLHLLYGCTASPSEKAFQTINDSPEANTFSWEVSTTPVPCPGMKATSLITIDSTTADDDDLAALETILYGTKATGSGQDTPARMPLPDEIADIFDAVVPGVGG